MSTTGISAINSAAKSTDMWPIIVKGAIYRHSPMGDPTIEKMYHSAMEDGRKLEKNISDANHWLLQKKQHYLHLIQAKLDTVLVGTDGQLKHKPRVIKLIADCVRLIKDVQEFQKNIAGVIAAVTYNLNLLLAMERNLLAMVQSILNSLALLLNNICNWHLPPLPSIPNLLGLGVFHWNGFRFSFSAFKPNLKFDSNFAFKQCAIQIPNINLNITPSVITLPSGNSFGSLQFIPPLDGSVANATNINDPGFVALMQSIVDVPIYSPISVAPDITTFTPTTSMIGSLPDPTTIISNYQMPPDVYQSNIVSLVLPNDVVKTTDSDYSNPDYVTRQANLRKDLVHYINLDAVVSSNYDPYVTSAWLYYLDGNRSGSGRVGSWLPNYEASYQTYIQPSATILNTIPIPWNTVLGGTGTLDAPTDIPLVDSLKDMSDGDRQVGLWKLSYVEAAILGYTRSTTWDAYQDANYLNGVTGSDLDYRPTSVDLSVTTTITLGEGSAEFPVSCTYPTAIAKILNEVIAQATIDIQKDTAYQSPRLGNRFTYNQFAQAAEVDRFSQFWRDFNYNMVSLLAQDPYLIQFAVTYFGTLNGALNPLGDATSYNLLKADASSRNRNWVPGFPLLPIPIAPEVSFQNDSTPSDGTSGWDGINFSASNFLSRPDVQAQTIPVQIAMLRTNISYAGVLQMQQQVQSEIQAQITNAQNILAQSQQIGFSVEADNVETYIPPSESVAVSFDTVDLDMTGNVTNQNTFTIQSEGEYVVYGTLMWEGSDTGQTRTVTLTQNGVPISTQSTDPNMVSPIILQLSITANFNEGDVVQVLASHGFSTEEIVGSGSLFGMVQSGQASTPVQLPPSSAGTSTFTASAPITSSTALMIQSDGTVRPLDPTVTLTSPGGKTLYPFCDGVALTSATTGQTVTTTANYGSSYTVNGATFTEGGLLYVGVGGVLTQNYDSLFTGGTGVHWIICVGRATGTNTFIYEPHIPYGLATS